MAKALTDFDLIVFDCDGVLVDSEALSCDCLHKMLCRYGYKIDLEGVFETFLGRGFGIVEEEFRRVLGYSLPQDFVAAHRALLRESFAASMRPMPGIERLLDGLAPRPSGPDLSICHPGRRGAPVRDPPPEEACAEPCADTLPRYCVASSSDGERLSFTLATAGLADRFGGRAYSADMVARCKPAPDLFLHAAAAMGAEPSETLVIEDSVSGVRAGKAAGMSVWGYVGGSHYAGRDGVAILAAAGADRVVADIADLGLH